MSEPENPTTLILLSGGINSTTLLFELTRMKSAPVLEAMIFNTEQATDDYEPARANANRAGVPRSLWNLPAGPFMGTGLYDQPEKEPPLFGGPEFELLMMLTNAAWRARQMGYQRIVTGHMECELSFPGAVVADMFVFVAEAAGLPEKIFVAPYFHLTKKDVFDIAKDINVLAEVTYYTNSCWEGEAEKKNPWGFGCGECVGCVRRKRGWEEYLRGLK